MCKPVNVMTIYQDLVEDIYTKLIDGISVRPAQLIYIVANTKTLTMYATMKYPSVHDDTTYELGAVLTPDAAEDMSIDEIIEMMDDKDAKEALDYLDKLFYVPEAYELPNIDVIEDQLVEKYREEHQADLEDQAKDLAYDAIIRLLDICTDRVFYKED